MSVRLLGMQACGVGGTGGCQRGSAFILERTRKHDLERNGLPNRA